MIYKEVCDEIKVHPGPFKIQNGWTKQKMKDQIKLKNNGSKAFASSICCYRTPDGNACAAGCFIPDELYSGSFEGISTDGFFNLKRLEDKIDISPEDLDRAKEIAKKFPLDVLGMQAMQRVHDDFKSAAFPGENPRNLHDELFQFIDARCYEEGVTDGSSVV